MHGVIGGVLSIVELQFGERYWSLLSFLLFGYILIWLDVDLARLFPFLRPSGLSDIFKSQVSQTTLNRLEHVICGTFAINEEPVQLEVEEIVKAASNIPTPMEE